MRPLILGTRGSALAQRQAELVCERLRRAVPAQQIRVEIIRSEADLRPEVPIAALGGEGVFVKELEAALLDRRIDLAVHSLKDVPLALPEGLVLSAILARDDARDAFVSRSGASFAALPAGARVGTSSLRRQSQLARWRGDLEFVEMRGNVDTRLRKLDEGRYDGIVLAACGLARLGLQQRITEYLDPSRIIPEPGQGAVAIESRAADAEANALIAELEHAASRRCIEAERACMTRLGGGCRLPMAAYARIVGDRVELDGIVLSPDGRRCVRDFASGPAAESRALGARLGARLEALGARALLDAAGSN